MKASIDRGFFYCASAMQTMLSSLHPCLNNSCPQASMLAPVVMMSSTSNILILLIFWWGLHIKRLFHIFPPFSFILSCLRGCINLPKNNRLTIRYSKGIHQSFCKHCTLVVTPASFAVTCIKALG